MACFHSIKIAKTYFGLGLEDFFTIKIDCFIVLLSSS